MTGRHEACVRRPGRGIVRWLTFAGAVLTVLGAATYVLPGPGLPVLVTGVLILLGPASLRLFGSGR
ncbi:hypothetical protein [Streptomyces glaucescens]|uniref:hypothetical protein n=1 Tax=Streptomyces glaucescens TaxID=1907 RepID=UPI000A38ED28|nr:hypothetical protein [Streptomyces glaucescens]